MHNALPLYHVLLRECGEMCSTNEWSRDFKTLMSRTLNEGSSFVTITLPSFLDSFMESIEKGYVDSTSFIGWKKRQCLPVFLKGFTSLVFDQLGVLREYSELQTTAIGAIRQICCLYKKVKQVCSIEREEKAIKEYCELDYSMQGTINRVSDNRLDTFIDVSRIITSHVFKGWDRNCLIPYHGPGATADRLKGNRKYDHRRLTWRKDFNAYFNIGETLYNSEESYFHDKREVREVDPVESMARLATVPKTQTKPRVIALEPCTTQMIQQPIKDFLVKCMEESTLTRGHVNFTDQGINKKLALVNSLTKELATIDLSSASDRVHKEFVYLMLSGHPELRDYIFCARSPWIQTPTSKFFLEKFASMGSALCFPIEALFFFVLCVQARLEAHGLAPSFQNIDKMSRKVYVYGDDILIPTDEVEIVYNLFHEFGNKVGTSKSYFRSNFRESCGVDAYCGIDVTPVYIRQNTPTQLKGQTERIISWVATANSFYHKGYFLVARQMKDMVEKVTGVLPELSATSAGLGWEFPCMAKTPTRLNRKLQRLEVKTLIPKCIPSKDYINGYSALFKSLLRLEKPKQSLDFDWSWKRDNILHQEQSDPDHLKRSMGFGTLTLQRRWSSVN